MSLCSKKTSFETLYIKDGKLSDIVRNNVRSRVYMNRLPFFELDEIIRVSNFEDIIGFYQVEDIEPIRFKDVDVDYFVGQPDSLQYLKKETIMIQVDLIRGKLEFKLNENT